MSHRYALPDFLCANPLAASASASPVPAAGPDSIEPRSAWLRLTHTRLTSVVAFAGTRPTTLAAMDLWPLLGAIEAVDIPSPEILSLTGDLGPGGLVARWDGAGGICAVNAVSLRGVVTVQAWVHDRPSVDPFWVRDRRGESTGVELVGPIPRLRSALAWLYAESCGRVERRDMLAAAGLGWRFW